MGTTLESDLRSGDGLYAQAFGCLGELHGAAQVVVVCKARALYPSSRARTRTSPVEEAPSWKE